MSGSAFVPWTTDGAPAVRRSSSTVATSNDPAAIDAAARRAGRFDVVLEIGPPDRDTRREILRHFIEKLARREEIDFDRLAEATEGATGADLREIIRRAFLVDSAAPITTEALLAAADGITSPGRQRADAPTGDVTDGPGQLDQYI